MDDVDALAVLARAESEGIPFNWMRKPHNDVDTASMYATEQGWRVSTTGERATEEAMEDYSDRALAMEDFVSRVQSFMSAKELRKRMSRL